MTVPVDTSSASPAHDTPSWDDIVAPYAWQLPKCAECGCPVWQHLELESLYIATHEGDCADGRSDADLGDRSGITPITRMGLAAMLRGGCSADEAFARVAAEHKVETAYASGDCELGNQLAVELAAYVAGAADARAAAAAPFTVPPAPGAAVPTAPAVPLPPVAPAAPLSPEQQLIADAIVERKTEHNALTVELGPYLSMLPPEERGVEVAAAMSMTRADRTEAVDAALSGLLSRRGLTLAELAPVSRSVRSAWERLREPEVSGDRYVDGGSFIHDIPDVTPAVWGHGADVLWAEGEDLIVAGPQGVGKSTIAGLLVQAMIEGGEVLGYPVKRVDKVLYLAMDRPQQIARALRRQLKHLDREFIAEHLKVWKGPPPEDLAKFPDRLLAMAEKANANVVVVDSLKDAALGLSSDEVGAGWNRARQTLLAAGIELLTLHHDRKANETSAPAVEKIYGSIWITGGAGSIIHIDGEPGDPIVRFAHVKKPDAEIGPFNLEVDNTAGTISIFEQVDLVAMARQPGGVTVTAAAAALYEVEKPTDAHRERVRRKLKKLEQEGKIAAGNVGGATVYTASTGLTVVEPPGGSSA
ncbi:AAA family ATPase [Mycolicibacter minnesotensis]